MHNQGAQAEKGLETPTPPVNTTQRSYAEAVKSDYHPNVDSFQTEARDRYEREMQALYEKKRNVLTIGDVNWTEELVQKDQDLKAELLSIMKQHGRMFSDSPRSL